MRDADGSDSGSFADVFGTFLDLASSTALMDASKPFKDRRLRLLLVNVARQHVKDQAAELAGLQMLHHAPSGLVHGAFFAGAHPGSFFFFLQEQQGIVAFVAGMSLTHYYRITATELPAGTVIGRKSRWKN
ncbi:MAG TPA: hypothetical protein VK034_28575 [Enhygromyxa sp.]|nr:hypothetical protein [Enhygromyxa sp.]